MPDDFAGGTSLDTAERLAAEALVVDVDGFEGPLDVLLMLSRTQKVDLRKISVFGSARTTPDDPSYGLARQLAAVCWTMGMRKAGCGWLSSKAKSTDSAGVIWHATNWRQIMS